MATSTCQSCLDDITGGKDNALLSKVCGKNCKAHICRQCMGRHVEVTLQQFYPGLLPRVRCPICLVAMHSSRWEGRVPDDTKAALTTKYAELCRQACAMTPPCCHKTGYTHLPPFNPEALREEPLKLLPSQVSKFKVLCTKFCRHKLEPRAVLDYAFNSFGEEKALTLVNELTLPRIQDPERRATLLLSLMYFRPNTKTNCCRADFCFNCKRRGHHESCVEEFDEGADLVRCRRCRVLLLKVEGCNTVNCVCGFSMNWNNEQSLRRQRKRGFLPVDIFDMPVLNGWFVFRKRQWSVLKSLRERWLLTWVKALRPLLDPVFGVYVWRFRLRMALRHSLSTEVETRRRKQLDRSLVTVKDVLRAAMAPCIWRRRFRKALVEMEEEMYWKAYHRWHPEESQAEAEEMTTLLSVGTFDE